MKTCTLLNRYKEMLYITYAEILRKLQRIFFVLQRIYCIIQTEILRNATKNFSVLNEANLFRYKEHPLEITNHYCTLSQSYVQYYKALSLLTV